MNKQEAIQAAYGEHWDKVKDTILDNGWTDVPETKCGYEMYPGDGSIEYVDEESSNYWRPATLTGIEDNNGWIPGLPPETESSWLFTKDHRIIKGSTDYMMINKRWRINNVTHWQPLVKGSVSV